MGSTGFIDNECWRKLLFVISKSPKVLTCDPRVLIDQFHCLTIQAGFAAHDKYIADWKRECEKDEAVNVFGIPFDTHFAQVMVKADYDLKRLSDGSDSAMFRDSSACQTR
jgi:hypothetical protein